MGPTMLLRATCAPLNHYFILKTFLKKFNTSFKKKLNFFNTIMLKCILKSM